MGRRFFLTLVVTALIWPTSSLAASGSLVNGVMNYAADNGESNNIVFTLDTTGSEPVYQLADAPAVQIAAQSPCFDVASNVMQCPVDGNGAGAITILNASLGDGNDTIAIQANLPTSIGAGGGDDTVNGGPAADTEDGQDGDDVLRGGNGNDTLTGGGGNDVFPAESSADGADDVKGGDGIDTATFAARTDPVQLSLDDVANDGVIGNAQDNLHSDVENLIGGSGGDVLTGSAASNALAGGPGDDALDGGAGADVLAGGDGTDLADYSSRTAGVAASLDGIANDGEPLEGDNVEPDVENLRGGSGADTFVGSAGDNVLDGGAGEDYSDGGAGSDTLVGGDSGDVMRSRGSAEPDTINCGPGPDFVIAKPADTISADCDRTDRGVNQKPRLRSAAVVTPSGGVLQFSPTGIVRRVPLQDKVVVPLRTIVDAIAGAVNVTSSATARKAQTVSLDSGAFDITQTAARLAVTQFALQGGDFTACTTAGRRAAAAAGQKSSQTVRMLWAKGKGRFRTRGRYAAAAIRGTRWQTVDRCDGTLIRVTQGVVTVQDLVKKTTVVVRAGRSYLARTG